MKWTISDGTTVQLGGNVSGKGKVAVALRADIAATARGEAVLVNVYPEPAGSEELNLSNPLHVHLWVADAARLAGETVTDAPEIEIPESESDPDEIY